MGAGELSRRRWEDGIEALKWLRGTEVSRIMHTLTEDSKSLIVRWIIHYFGRNR